LHKVILDENYVPASFLSPREKGKEKKKKEEKKKKRKERKEILV
jgi:hypothetical protein